MSMRRGLSEFYRTSLKGNNNTIPIVGWDTRRFVAFTLILQALLWGTIAFDSLGVHIPFLRQVVGFVYLTILPGMLILRILKLHNLGVTMVFLFGIGLSLATLTFAGLLTDLVLPYFGMLAPLSLVPLLVVISCIVTLSAAICLVRDNESAPATSVSIQGLTSRAVLALFLIPFMAIFGAYAANYYHTGVLLSVTVAVIALVVVLIGFDRGIHKNLYPLVIFVIALTLLYHVTLISPNMLGLADSIQEYWTAKSVLLGSFWDITIPSSDTLRPSTSTTILMPIYATILNVDLTWIFKVVWPLLEALLPVCIYQVVSKQVKGNEKIAFYSSFFFVAYYGWYTDMPGQNRLLIAELFLMLLILLIVDETIDRRKQPYLFLVFGACVVVTHYTLAYIFLIALVMGSLVLGLLDYFQRERIQVFGRRSSRDNESVNPEKQNRKEQASQARSAHKRLSLSFIVLFAILTVAWTLSVSHGRIYSDIAQTAQRSLQGFQTDFLNPKVTTGLSAATQVRSTLVTQLLQIINYSVQGFIIVGVLTSLRKRTRHHFNAEYLALSLCFLVLLVAAVVVPYFSLTIGTDRLYEISILFLAPFCVIGAMIIFSSITKSLARIVVFAKQKDITSAKILSIFFAVYFLFNVGFIQQLANEPRSIALDPSLIAVVPHYNSSDIAAASWLNSHKLNGADIRADFFYSYVTLATFGSFVPLIEYNNSLLNVSGGDYFFLGTDNVINGSITVTYIGEGLTYRATYGTLPLQGSQLEAALANRSVIYDSRTDRVYY